LQSAASDLPLIEAAARDAGGLVRDLLRKPLEIRSKGEEGPVTNVDLAVNAFLLERLMGARPDYGWLSEETPDNPEERVAKPRVFMLDPIDGTAAMIARVPQFTISIGIAENGQAAAGAVYNPLTDELYVGAPTVGATLNGVATHASARDTLEGARMVGEKMRYSGRKWPKPWPDMEFFPRQSIAYRLALVAAGQADATILFGWKHEWDIAAGAAIVEAAGGRVTDPWGNALTLNQSIPRAPGVVAAGAALHPLIIERTAHVRDPRKAKGA
jgi:myo-inositol-1(or 4)-monophosphatase